MNKKASDGKLRKNARWRQSNAERVLDVLASAQSVLERIGLGRILLGLDEEPSLVVGLDNRGQDGLEVALAVARDGEHAGEHRLQEAELLILDALQHVRTDILEVEVADAVLVAGDDVDRILAGELQVADVNEQLDLIRVGVLHEAVDFGGGLLAGLIEPVCGTVTINDGGCRIYDADSRWKAGRLAYVHQESTVFNETLRDNITLHRPWLTDDDIVRACEVAGINEGMMDPVVGLDAMVSERGMNLSGGQRQKVAIARAVVGRPDFLLMDEPTSALDNDTERHVMTALLDSDNACIVVAHRLASIRDFDRIHVMDHGQIVESGTHDELLQAGGLYSRLYRQE